MLAVTISVDNRRLVARLVPAGTMTEAEVLKLGYKFDFRFFQLKLEAFSISLHRFAALAGGSWCQVQSGFGEELR